MLRCLNTQVVCTCNSQKSGLEKGAPSRAEGHQALLALQHPGTDATETRQAPGRGDLVFAQHSSRQGQHQVQAEWSAVF